MKAPRRRSRALAQLDAEIEAKAQRIIDRIEATRSKMKKQMEEIEAKIEADRLAGEPSLAALSSAELLTVVKAKRRELEAQTDAERRRARVEWMSIIGHPVRKIADAVGMTYYSVVQLRRELGVSRKRRRP